MVSNSDLYIDATLQHKLYDGWFYMACIQSWICWLELTLYDKEQELIMLYSDMRDALKHYLVTENGRGQEKNVVDGLHAIASAINEHAHATEEVAKAIRDAERKNNNG